MNKTGIEYLTHTWNPIAMRCNPLSPACDHCWHLTTANRMKNNPMLTEPERAALAGGEFFWRHWEINAPERMRSEGNVIGVQFMGDLFHHLVPDDYILQVWMAMIRAPMQIFVVLTKRPDRAVEWFKKQNERCQFPILKNVWIGTTVEDQDRISRLKWLLRIPALHRFASIEPCLSGIDIIPYLPHRWRCSGCGYRTNDNIGRCKGYCHDATGKSCDAAPCPKCGKVHYWCGSMASLDLVIAGGETGPGARPMDHDWVWSIKEQCLSAGVPFFFKGWGEWVNAGCRAFGKYHGLTKVMKSDGTFWDEPSKDENADACTVVRVGKKRSGRDLGGREWNELPWRKPA